MHNKQSLLAHKQPITSADLSSNDPRHNNFRGGSGLQSQHVVALLQQTGLRSSRLGLKFEEERVERKKNKLL